MPLDEAILREARQRRDRLLELQHEADRERLEYQYAIRRLHAAGASMREIAEQLGLSHQRVHQIVDALAGEVGAQSARGVGPHLAGRRHQRRLGGPFARFTKRAREVVVLAQEEARQMSHAYIGTEHILLGLLRAHDGLAARVLESLGVELETTRGEILRIIGEGPPEGVPRRGRRRSRECRGGTAGPVPFTPRAKKVLELALREARALGHNYIGTEHVLLALVAEGEGVAAEILDGLGADGEKIRGELMGMLSG